MVYGQRLIRFFLRFAKSNAFYRVLLGFTEFYRVLPSFTEFYRVFPVAAIESIRNDDNQVNLALRFSKRLIKK